MDLKLNCGEKSRNFYLKSSTLGLDFEELIRIFFHQKSDWWEMADSRLNVETQIKLRERHTDRLKQAAASKWWTLSYRDRSSDRKRFTAWPVWPGAGIKSNPNFPIVVQK